MRWSIALNAALRFPDTSQATDVTLLEQFASKLKEHPHFAKTGLKQEGDFIIKHYAGKVTYCIKDWIVKNKDPLNTNITALLEKSSDPFVERLWRSEFCAYWLSAVDSLPLVPPASLLALPILCSSVNLHS